MNILKFDQQEYEEYLDNGKQNLEGSGETMDKHMKMSFESLIFLGNRIKENPDLLDVAIFNIRLCYTYYKLEEDYLKLTQLVDLAKIVETSVESKVDADILNDITINLN